VRAGVLLFELRLVRMRMGVLDPAIVAVHVIVVDPGGDHVDRPVGARERARL